MNIIERRYQYYSSNGIVWTKWFEYDKFDTLKESETYINLHKKDKEPNKKLKSEYRIKTVTD